MQLTESDNKVLDKILGAIKYYSLIDAGFLKKFNGVSDLIVYIVSQNSDFKNMWNNASRTKKVLILSLLATFLMVNKKGASAEPYYKSTRIVAPDDFAKKVKYDKYDRYR
jgi:hypothetical protein